MQNSCKISGTRMGSCFTTTRTIERLKTSDNGRAYHEILEIAARIFLIQFAGKSTKNPKLIYLQTCVNRVLDYVLNGHYGWSRQVPTIGGLLRHVIDFYKDFDGVKVFLEVETGNVSRGDSDIHKHLHASLVNIEDVAITIVPMPDVADKMDSNVANLHRVAKVLASSEIFKDKPHLVIGIPERARRIVNVEDWGYSLKSLKSSADTPEKAALAERVWREYIFPTLPLSSYYHAYREQVRKTDIDTGKFPPRYQTYCTTETKAPIIQHIGSDGTLLQKATLPVKAVNPRERKSRIKKRPLQKKRSLARKACKSRPASANRVRHQRILLVVRNPKAKLASGWEEALPMSTVELMNWLARANAASQRILATNQLVDGSLDAASVARMEYLEAFKARLVARLLAAV